LQAQSQIIYRSDIKDNGLVDSYNKELQTLAKKHGIHNAFGFCKTITNRDGQLNETTIIFYTDSKGETQDRIVSARTIHREDKKQKPDVDSGLNFQPKRVIKNNNGYVIAGDMKDNGDIVPIVLTTYKTEENAALFEDSVDGRFSINGSSLYDESMAVGSIFSLQPPFANQKLYLIKVLYKDANRQVGWYGRQDDKCYVETFVVPYEFWNSRASNMSWRERLIYMREHYIK
jgi:hypothetical protein